MTRLDDIELIPYKYAGEEHRIFLTPLDLFRASIDGGTLIERSRKEIETKIAEYWEGQGKEKLFFPIIRIHALNSRWSYGFGVSRYWVSESLDGAVYWCAWHTPPERRVGEMKDAINRFPADIGIDALPFIDFAEGGHVYYTVFKENLWMAFYRLDDRLADTLTENKNRALANLATDESHSALQLHDMLYTEVLTP